MIRKCPVCDNKNLIRDKYGIRCIRCGYSNKQEDLDEFSNNRHRNTREERE